MGNKAEMLYGFEENLLEHINSLYNLAYYMTRNREDAHDLVQETSLRGFRFYDKFEKGTNFKAWMMTILRNLFINQYRKKVKEPGKVEFELVENYISSPNIDGATEEIFGETLHQSLEKLPEELRAIVVLFYVDGLSYKEIAKVMKCPMGTVMSRLYAARKMLKKHIEDIQNSEVIYEDG